MHLHPKTKAARQDCSTGRSLLRAALKGGTCFRRRVFFLRENEAGFKVGLEILFVIHRHHVECLSLLFGDLLSFTKEKSISITSSMAYFSSTLIEHIP